MHIHIYIYIYIHFHSFAYFATVDDQCGYVLHPSGKAQIISAGLPINPRHLLTRQCTHTPGSMYPYLRISFANSNFFPNSRSRKPAGATPCFLTRPSEVSKRETADPMVVVLCATVMMPPPTNNNFF